MNYNKTKSIQSVYLGFNAMLDSQVSAILLSKQGYKVKGIYFYIKPDRIPKCCEQVSSKFLFNHEELRNKAKHLNISLDFVDVTDSFRCFIVDRILADRIEVLYSNTYQYIFNFITEKLQKLYPDQLKATGHFIKSQRINETVEVLRHTDVELDQSFYLQDLMLITKMNFQFPLGDLGKKELNNLVKKFKLSKLLPTNVKPQTRDNDEFIPASLKFDVYEDTQLYKNIELEFSARKRSFSHSFVINNGKSVQNIDTTIFELKDTKFALNCFERPKKIFALTDQNNELESVVISPKTLGRALLETERKVDLFPNQLIHFYESKYQNAKFIGSAFVSSYVQKDNDD